MKPAVLFDLGNTLVAYYHTDEFEPILRLAIRGLVTELASRKLSDVSFDTAMTAAIAENAEASDFRFTPMVERFERIFEVELGHDSRLAGKLCEIFLGPIFEVGRLYEDALPALDALRKSGHATAIVSNAPWGSPPELWRRELSRLGLGSAVDRVVLCGDAGWRKPAPQIFRYAAAQLDCSPEKCIFVGDDLRWDIAGSKAVGMRPLLIDRDRRNSSYDGETIDSLGEIFRLVEDAA